MNLEFGGPLSGAEEITLERLRQENEEGWTPEHDERWTEGELARAGLTYLLYALGVVSRFIRLHQSYYASPTPPTWPWDPEWFKPTGYRRCLVKVGALIAAEIDRYDRLQHGS